MTPDERIRQRLEQDPTIQSILRDLFWHEPSYRFWEAPSGHRFIYTTERLADGKFASAIYRPAGKGSRSGRKAVTRLLITREVHHSTRRAAKARAYKLYRQHMEEQA